MEKDFDKWHGKKSIINKIQKRPFFHEREISFCYFGSQIRLIDARRLSRHIGIISDQDFIKLTEKTKALLP